MPEISAQQILVPKKVYIGDTAELRCTFNSPDEALKEYAAQGTIKLTNDSFIKISNNKNIFPESDYQIKNITLSPAGVDFYQITVTFVPWKTGEITFPPLCIEGTDINLTFQPVNIVSLINTDEKNATALRETAGPLLLPGTAYKLYSLLAAAILILLVIIRIVIKRKKLIFYLNTKKLLRKYKKNKKQTIKKLQQIEEEYTEANEDSNKDSKEASDKIAAEKIQQILRTYMEIRFDFPFTTSVTSEIMPGFYKATSGLLSEKKEEAFCDIASSFIRTDFIRYSSNAEFEKGELSDLIKQIVDKIEIIELIEKPEEEKNA